jgi:hypothetical protein
MPRKHDPENSESAAQLEAQENARTFAQIPIEQLPWPAVRAALIYRALAGYDCYAYQPAHLTWQNPRWVIWDRQPNPYEESRFAPREWAIKHGFQVDGPEGGAA